MGFSKALLRPPIQLASYEGMPQHSVFNNINRRLVSLLYWFSVNETVWGTR